MKMILITILSLFSISSFAQKSSFNIIGKWQNTEYHGNDGATDYVNKLANGRIYAFEKEGMVRDSTNSIGYYQLNGDSLRITFNDQIKYYRIFYQNINADTIALSPVSEKYQFICDEGCSEIFVRRKSKTAKDMSTSFRPGSLHTK